MSTDKQARLIKSIEEDNPRDMHQVLDELVLEYSDSQLRKVVGTINSIAERQPT